ncbi:MAG: ERCC4 domain-containing protein [Oliverpabstia sp.]|nr:ERCC4 domain-containing protein [Oliverpabstia sp.]
MTLYNQEKVLQSMEILVDSREQPTERARKRYERFGCLYRRVTLSYGDYAYNAVLPDGSYIYDVESTVAPHCVVERKMDLDELAACFCKGRKRFTREFERAADAGARIYLIVENGSWENLLNGKYRTRMNAAAYKASIIAFMVRYNMNLLFCKEETSGELIREILYRDLKERLERGELG